MVHKTGVHKCPECPKTFSRLEYVNRHRRVKHLGIRAWSCSCGANYARSDLLTRHRKRCKAQELNSANTKKDHLSASSVLPSTSNTLAASQCDDTYYDDKEPPTYQQAISEKPAFSIEASNPSDLQIQPATGPAGLSYHPPPSTNAVEEVISLVSNTSPGEFTLRSGADALGHFVPSDHDLGDARDNINQNQDENVSEVPTRDLDDSTSVVPIVRYSDPNFFISDVPETSPFYLNPHIWVLAFMCQKSQGFTIPHMGSLSLYLSRATEVMCPVIPMIHVPTLRAPNISIHLGYALSVAGAALETSEHALAFTDQSLSYKRISVQNDFLSRNRSFGFRFELFQSLITYQFLGMFSRLEVQRNRSLRFSPTIIRNFRELAFTETIRKTPDYVQLALSGRIPMEPAWKLWVQYEVQKRTAFLVLISSLQLGGPDACGLTLSETNLHLPCHEDLWTARSPEEWAEAARRQAMHCWLDNMQTNEIVVSPSSIQDLSGEQSVPLLSEALAALHISNLTEMQRPISDIHRVGVCGVTVRAERLGSFAKTVIHHARSLTHQATVSIRLLDPPQLNI
ncbi:hypothetical protein PCASD_07905 [Puccinia coronata f. sp. avenae]|uniref:C2H2-type domain-containing protein n=1 Tax=Puccinia coronata f. sp. avenae TaxID=200324 RepID=A0A2N5UQ31_9BASI|nr:hypothetical protein PCASD_07905 [Puccinia coronata f. sp. avenae]